MVRRARSRAPVYTTFPAEGPAFLAATRSGATPRLVRSTAPGGRRVVNDTIEAVAGILRPAAQAVRGRGSSSTPTTKGCDGCPG
jgi:hypothetical protein